MGLAPGDFVSKQVQLVRLLKRGGMGSVWIADHLGLKNQVAVKFMAGKVADDPSMVTRFNREATSCAQIKSPHVVQVHDHGVTGDGDPYIVMELLEGEDLASLLRRKSRLSLDDIGSVINQMGRVLRKAHALGIVHRDIKPSNIFLVDSGGEELFIKLLDFGVAKMGSDESDITSTGATVGTMVYMAPEQLLSARRVDQRADLWSVAVVAYRAITGELPFRDDDGVGALIRALDLAVFKPASSLVEGLPPEVDAWFARAFERDPALRFGSARELADEFLLAIDKAHAVAQASHPSTASPLKRIRQEPTEGPTITTNPSNLSSIGAAKPRAPLPSTTLVDPASRPDPPSNAVPGETLAGTASLPEIAGLRRARRWPKIVLGGLAIAVIAGVALYVVGPGRFGVSSQRGRLTASAAAPETARAPGTATPAPSSANGAPAPPTPSADPSVASTAPPVEEPPSSAPAASVRGQRPLGRPRVGGRQTEKDYGF